MDDGKALRNTCGKNENTREEKNGEEERKGKGLNQGRMVGGGW